MPIANLALDALYARRTSKTRRRSSWRSTATPKSEDARVGLPRCSSRTCERRDSICRTGDHARTGSAASAPIRNIPRILSSRSNRQRPSRSIARSNSDPRRLSTKRKSAPLAAIKRFDEARGPRTRTIAGARTIDPPSGKRPFLASINDFDGVSQSTGLIEKLTVPVSISCAGALRSNAITKALDDANQALRRDGERRDSSGRECLHAAREIRNAIAPSNS